jgi:hypothetical protein
MERFSLKRLSEDNLWGGCLYWRLEDTLREALDIDISLHRGPVTETGGDSLDGAF